MVGNQTYASLVKGKVVTEKEMVKKGFTKGDDDSGCYDGWGISAKEVEDRVVRKTVNSGGRHSGSNGGNNVISSSGGCKVTNTVSDKKDVSDDDNNEKKDNSNSVETVDNNAGEWTSGAVGDGTMYDAWYKAQKYKLLPAGRKVALMLMGNLRVIGQERILLIIHYIAFLIWIV